MPTMPERMAVVETAVTDVKADVHEIKTDVKLLVSWRDEERGARRQNRKLIAFSLTIASIVTSAIVNFVLKVVA